MAPLFHEPETHATVDFRTMDLTICHIYPAEARDPDSCSGVGHVDDAALLALRRNQRLISVSIIRLGEPSAIVVISSKYLPATTQNDVSAKGARDIQIGDQRGASERNEPAVEFYWPGSAEPFNLFVMEGIPGIRYLSRIYLTDPPAIRAVHNLYARDGFIGVTVEGIGLSSDAVIALGELVLSRVSSPPRKQDATGFTTIDVKPNQPLHPALRAPVQRE
jgi:hypothetical protein